MNTATTEKPSLIPATATTQADHVHIELTQQQRHLVAGRYCLPVGVAHEYILRGVAKVLPESAKPYEAFAKASAAAAMKYASKKP